VNTTNNTIEKVNRTSINTLSSVMLSHSLYLGMCFDCNSDIVYMVRHGR